MYQSVGHLVATVELSVLRYSYILAFTKGAELELTLTTSGTMKLCQKHICAVQKLMTVTLIVLQL